MEDASFDFDQVFDDDYLYFYGPRLENVADGDADVIWRLLALEPRMDVLDLACGHGRIAELLPPWLPVVVNERDGDFAIDRQLSDPASGRALTERTIVRDGHTRQFSFSVRMFIAAELRDWLLAAGFSSVKFFDHTGESLTAQSPRIPSRLSENSGKARKKRHAAVPCRKPRAVATGRRCTRLQISVSDGRRDRARLG